MADDANDTLMTFTNGMKFETQCQATWDKGDSMKEKFEKGCFFEIEDFSLGGGLESEDYHEENNNKAGSSSSSNQSNRLKGQETKQTGGSSGKSNKSSHGGKFIRYILGDDKAKYPADLQEISISRQLDTASPIFMQACLTQKAFETAIIVKRKVVGGALDKPSIRHLGFLRLEFTKPLITSIDWDDGDIVKEKLKFICQGISMSYRPQKNDGTLGNPVSMTWKPSSSLTG